LSVYVLVPLVFAACGAHGASAVRVPERPDAVVSTASGRDSAVATSLGEFIAKARAAAAEARPPLRQQLPTAEAADPRLAAAIAVARLVPSPETLRAAATEYRRLGIVDRAHQFLLDALRLNGRDTATYDALARLWRDSGVPGAALADAHRAVYYAPSSAVAHNTLGTVFQALGRRKDARKEYERAVTLDPTAAYALNNLCYGWILEGEIARAAAACRSALALEPELDAARNNLGLVYAARGELDAARLAFEGVGDPATAHYNVGIVQMARRRYRDAVSAFAAAQRARPSMRMAGDRALQAEQLARAGAEE
jgi:Flp pilus assembly protein TadD